MGAITVEADERAVRIGFDRPEKRNALSREMSHEIAAALGDHTSTAAPVVFGSTTPGMFVAGTDIAALRERTVDESLARLNADLFQKIGDHPWPTIAAVDGYALGGGCELALACDFRVSTATAQWGFPEVRLGIIPSAGGLSRLPKMIGAAAATDLLLTGRRIDGQEAWRLGLVQRLADADGLDAAVDDLLTELAKTSLFAVRLAKEAMRVDGDRHRLVDAAAQALCIGSEEAQRRMAALLERQR